MAYPIREPFNDLEYKNRQNSYKKLLLKFYQKDNTFDDDVPVSLKEIYTPLKLGSQERSEKEEVLLSIEEAIVKHQFIAISGVAGSGKSTITKFLSIATAENGVNNTIKKIGKRLVLPFILRELEFEKINSFDSLFSQWIEKLNREKPKEKFTKEFFNFYIRQGWAILIFDGFDEIGAEKNKKLIGWLNDYIIQNALSQQKEIKTNIIITGRPTGFLQDINYDIFHKLYLQPYDQEQVEIYSKNYFTIKYAHQPHKIEEKSKLFLERLEKFEDLKQLKSRPIYLMMLAHISENKGELPKTRTLAYQQMIESYIHILDKQKELYEKEHQIELPQWDLFDKTILLEELAYKIHTKADKELQNKENEWERDDISQLQIQVSKDEIRKYIEEIVKDSRFNTIQEGESIDTILDYYLSRTGLLIEPKDDFVQFSHLSFQEYLTASRIYRKQPKRKVEEYLKKELFDNMAKTGWSEIALLFYGIDSLKQGEEQSEQLQFLIDETNPKHLDFLVKLIALTENRFTEDEIKRWFKTIIFILINTSDISKFSEMIRGFSRIIKEESREDHLLNIERDMNDYLFKIAKHLLNHKKFHNKDELLFTIEEDTNDLAYRMQHIVQTSNNVDMLENVIYIGYHFKEFRHNFLSKDTLKKLADKKGSGLYFILDKYIPFNIQLSTEISNKVLQNIELYQIVELNGSHLLRHALRYTDNKFYKEIVKLQFLVNKNLLFLLTNESYKNDVIYISKIIAKYYEKNLKLLESIPRLNEYNGHIQSGWIFDIGRRECLHFKKDNFYTTSFHVAPMLGNKRLNKSFEILVSTPIKNFENQESFWDLNNKSLLYVISQSAAKFAKEMKLSITISKKEYQNLYDCISANPIEYFMKYNLTDIQINEINELFEKTSLLELMTYTLEHAAYQEFDNVSEKKVLELFNKDLKNIIKKTKPRLDKIEL